MKIFWYSDYSLEDLKTYASLILAFEHIVVPSPNNTELFFDHKRLELPPDISDINNAKFYPASGYELLGSYISTGDDFLDLTRFGYEFVEAQYKAKTDYASQYELFVKVAGINNGLLVGRRQISGQPFEILRESLESCLRNNNANFNLIKAVLSVAGVEVALLNAIPKDMETILRLKEKYIEELKDYQSYISELLNGSWEIINSDPTFDEIVNWSTFVADTKIEPSLRRLESAIRKGDKKLLTGIGIDLVAQAPLIGANIVSQNNASVLQDTLIAVLKILAPKLARSLSERNMLANTFGLSYLYRIRKKSI